MSIQFIPNMSQKVVLGNDDAADLQQPKQDTSELSDAGAVQNQFLTHVQYNSTLQDFELLREPVRNPKKWVGVYGDELNILLSKSEEDSSGQEESSIYCQPNEILVEPQEDIVDSAFVDQVLTIPEEFSSVLLENVSAQGPNSQIEEQHLLSLIEKNVITPIERLEILLYFIKKMHVRIYSNLFEKGPEWVDDMEVSKHIPENLKVVIEDHKWTVKNIWEYVLLPPEYGSGRVRQIVNEGRISVWNQDPIIVFNTGMIATKLFPNVLSYPSLYHSMAQVDYTKTSILKTIEILEQLKEKWSDTVRSRDLIIQIT